MKTNCKHVHMKISSNIPFQNISEFMGGVFVWNNGSDWHLSDRTNIYVECSDCKKHWQGDYEDFPEWIQNMLDQELKVFGENNG